MRSAVRMTLLIQVATIKLAPLVIPSKGEARCQAMVIPSKGEARCEESSLRLARFLAALGMTMAARGMTLGCARHNHGLRSGMALGPVKPSAAARVYDHGDHIRAHGRPAHPPPP